MFAVAPTRRRQECENPNGIPTRSPRLRGTSYLGWQGQSSLNPNGVAACCQHRRHNPVGVERYFTALTQGSSFLATLGSMKQSLWDWCWPPSSHEPLQIFGADKEEKVGKPSLSVPKIWVLLFRGSRVQGANTSGNFLSGGEGRGEGERHTNFSPFARP